MKTYQDENNLVAYNLLLAVSQRENIALPETLMDDLKKWSQPCRLEPMPRQKLPILLDVCHNLEGYEATINTIR